MGPGKVLGSGLLTLGVLRRETALGRYRSGFRGLKQLGLVDCRRSGRA